MGLPPLAAVRLYHLKGNDFRDLRTGAAFEIYYDNAISEWEYIAIDKE